MKKKRRRRQIDETSGYSTTSLSEVSEVDTPKRRANRRPNQARQENLSEDGRTNANPQRRRENLSDDRSERSRLSRTSETGRKSSQTSLLSTTPRNDVRKISQASVLSNTRTDCDKALVRNSRIRSTTDSLASVHSSKPNQYENNQRRISTSSSRLDVQSLANRKLYGSRETLDPFAFIQPAPEPFGRKIRKTCRPIFGFFVMLILAASLGAAIYFAVELKSKNISTV